MSTKTFVGTRGKVVVTIESDCNTTVTALDPEGKVLNELKDKGHPTNAAITEVVKDTGVSGTEVAIYAKEAIRQINYPC